MSDVNRRRIKLIDRNFQIKLMVKFIVCNALAMALFGFLLYLFFKSEVSASLASAHVAYKNMSDMLLPIVLTLSALNILAVSLGIAFLVLYSSHKIAGPLYRFNEAIKGFSEKNFQVQASLRESDQLQELSKSLTSARDSVGSDLLRIREKVEELHGSLGDGATDTIIVGLSDIKNVLDQYKL